MNSIVAAIVPLSAAATGALARERNKRWTSSISVLSPSLQRAVKAEFTDEADGPIFVYDAAHHAHNANVMRFGRARTAQVQLLGPGIDMEHIRIGFDTAKDLLSLTNSSLARPLPIDCSRTGPLELSPGAAVDLLEPTTFRLHAYVFRIFPYEAANHSPDVSAIRTIDPVGHAAEPSAKTNRSNAARSKTVNAEPHSRADHYAEDDVRSGSTSPIANTVRAEKTAHSKKTVDTKPLPKVNHDARARLEVELTAKAVDARSDSDGGPSPITLTKTVNARPLPKNNRNAHARPKVNLTAEDEAQNEDGGSSPLTHANTKRKLPRVNHTRIPKRKFEDSASEVSEVQSERDSGPSPKRARECSWLGSCARATVIVVSILGILQHFLP